MTANMGQRVILCYFMLLHFILTNAADISVDYYARFQHIGLADGLPNKYITVIREDDRGFIWIGTRDGLARFDGNNFITFLTSEDSCSISNNYIMDLAFDPKGNLWVATHNGLNKFDIEKQCFEKTPLITETGHGISHPYVRAILPEKDFIWVETLDGILHRMDYGLVTTRLYPHNRIHQEYYDYHALFRDQYDNLWVGGRGVGPMYLDLKRQTFNNIENDPVDPNKKRDMDVAFYFEDSNGGFWTGATDGVYHYDRGSDVFTKILASSTYDIVEDNLKNLWMASGSGLYRYDLKKKSFIKYVHFESDPYSLSDNHVKCVFKDRLGRIWAGTQNGISIWSEEKNQIKHYRHLPHYNKSLSDDHVTTFLEDQNNRLWVGTMGGGMNLKENNSNNFERWTQENSDLLSNRISSLHQSPDGTFWIGHWTGRGFQKLDANTKLFESFAISPNSRKIDWYNDLEDYNDSLLVTGIWGGRGLYFFDKNEKKYLPDTWRKLYHPVDAPIKQMAFDGQSLWIDSHINLIHSFDTRNQEFTGYQSDFYKYDRSHLKLKAAQIPSRFRINQLYAAEQKIFFLTDKELFFKTPTSDNFYSIDSSAYQAITYKPESNQYWLGSQSRLFILNQDMKLKHINTTPKNERIVSLSNFNSNELLVATPKEMLIYDLARNIWVKRDAWTLYNSDERRILKNIAIDQKQTIIIHPQGFSYYNSQLDSVQYFDYSTAFHFGLTSNIIYDAIKHIVSNKIWLATDRGLFAFEPASYTFKKLPYLKEITIYQLIKVNKKYYLATEKGLIAIGQQGEVTPYNLPPKDMITSHLISFTKKDRQSPFIWTGTTNKGLNRINIETQNVEHFSQDNGYYGQSAMAFCQLSDGEIFVGGETLNHFNQTSAQFDIPEYSSLIPKESIIGLAEDKKGDLWIVTERHVLFVNLITNALTDITPAIKVENLSFTGSIISTKHGKLNIGSDKGFFQIDPTQILNYTPKTQIQVTSFKAAGSEQRIHINTGDRLELDPQENFFSIKFSPMDIEEINTEYAYQLQGVDEDWITTTSNTVSYTKIPHGNYSFLVKRKDENYADAFSFHLNIKHPFWASWWFISAFILFNLALIIYWWSLQLSRIRISEKNLDLKQRLLLSQMNPHFIFNMLTTIQGFIYKKRPEIAGDHLSKFARLMRLYLSNMSQEYVSMEEEKDTLCYYLELQKVRQDEHFDYEVNISSEEPLELIGLPTMIIQPFIENAVIHGVNDLDYQGKISCDISLKNDHWSISIKDNGLGYAITSSKDHEKIHSVDITRSRLKILGKHFKKKFILKVTNLKEETGNETGTCIELTLPVVEIERRNHP